MKKKSPRKSSQKPVMISVELHSQIKEIAVAQGMKLGALVEKRLREIFPQSQEAAQ